MQLTVDLAQQEIFIRHRCWYGSLPLHLSDSMLPGFEIEFEGADAPKSQDLMAADAFCHLSDRDPCHTSDIGQGHGPAKRRRDASPDMQARPGRKIRTFGGRDRHFTGKASRSDR
ncbi:hypothetical protein [Sphingopyxis sp. JAI128]|uniref:hypothetical protein n=1 Tax=Sphingopyxis sp. JAI128 TaxID=2723066 RepID=UPI001617D0AE|nr:hypothetical protein [Sphingopyxis sp. JAI128]